ncbi:MAG TPA: hypothetical protein VHG90_11070 [Acidimicrobiales bacterium]|nr:hypothetical protein [Acidimicrobiales bacterium]
MPRHDLDALSLMAGVGFVGVALAGLLHAGPGLPLRWVAPALLIVVGVVGLVATRASRRT